MTLILPDGNRVKPVRRLIESAEVWCVWVGGPTDGLPVKLPEEALLMARPERGPF